MERLVDILLPTLPDNLLWVKGIFYIIFFTVFCITFFGPFLIFIFGRRK